MLPRSSSNECPDRAKNTWLNFMKNLDGISGMDAERSGMLQAHGCYQAPSENDKGECEFGNMRRRRCKHDIGCAERILFILSWHETAGLASVERMGVCPTEARVARSITLVYKACDSLFFYIYICSYFSLGRQASEYGKLDPSFLEIMRLALFPKQETCNGLC